MPSTEIVIKGTRYYSAIKAFEAGRLQAGSKVTLVPENDNKYDAEAVRIDLLPGNEVLGHVARDIAPKYRQLVLAGALRNAAIKSAEWESSTNGSRYLRVSVALQYEASSSSSEPTALNLDRLPNTPGVYQISNYRRRWIYIGSTGEIRTRLENHFRSLQAGTHDNSHLQDDYRYQSGRGFSVQVLATTDSARSALEIEAAKILAAVKAGHKLYNLTRDGQGRIPATLDRGSGYEPTPISDQRWARRRTFNRPAQSPMSTPVAMTDQPQQHSKSSFTPHRGRFNFLLFVAFALVVLWLAFRK